MSPVCASSYPSIEFELDPSYGFSLTEQLCDIIVSHIMRSSDANICVV